MPNTGRARRYGGLAVGALAVGVGGWLAATQLVYPRVGSWYVTSRVVPRIEARLGRTISVGAIEVGVGRAVLRDVAIRGPLDDTAPLAHFDQIDVEFDGAASWVGRAKLGSVAVRGGIITVRRRKDGVSNIDDLAARLRGSEREPAETQTPSGMGRVARAAVSGIRVAVDDEASGWKGGAEELTASLRDGALEVAILRPRASAELEWSRTLGGAPRGDDFGAAEEPPDLRSDSPVAATPRRTVMVTTVGAERLTFSRGGGAPRRVTVTGGNLEPWKGLALTGIAGQAEETADGRLAIALRGGYGGVDDRLWTADGWLNLGAVTGELRLSAAQFSLDRLRPLLEHSSLVDYQRTTVDAELTLSLSRSLIEFRGGFHLRDLAVGHPMLAEKVVPALEIAGEVAGSFVPATRTLALTRGDFASRGLSFRLTGALALPGGRLADGTRRELPAVTGRFEIPPIDCQRALQALPPEMTPAMQGFELRGTFATDLRIAIDLADVLRTELDGAVGIRGCRIVKVPPELERLRESFEHNVEVTRDQWISFVIGPENPGFVPLAQVSPHLLNAFMTTEDGAFYSHHGFIAREFKSALIKNLEAGYFKFGASSITMQTVKNVLLYREKTLSRKLQELFLTWAIEQVLDKDRILEIYVNAIEFGPGLYGIGPAAQHYFGKAASELTPREAAFFSSILPSPKARYRQYCSGALSKWSVAKIDRILALMLKRGRLSQADYDAVAGQPLVFAKDGTETEEACQQRVTKALAEARPTNPLKK